MGNVASKSSDDSGKRKNTSTRVETLGKGPWISDPVVQPSASPLKSRVRFLLGDRPASQMTLETELREEWLALLHVADARHA
jgi:hypothetical protein